MKQINVQPTAEIIDQMSERAQGLMRELDKISDKMRSTGDLEYASEAQQAVLSYVSNCRLDLLITRPLREFLKEE